MKKTLQILTIGLFLFGCTNEDTNLTPEESLLLEEEIISTLLVNYEIPDDDIFHLQQLGFSGSPVEVYNNFNSISNENFISYLVEGDIEIKSENLENLLPKQSLEKGGSLTSQYRTTIIARPNTYYIVSFGFIESNLQIGLTSAIENYNNLNLDIRFERRSFRGSREFGTFLRQNKNSIWFRPSSIEGGSAGFPSRDGNVYGSIKVNSTLGRDSGVDVAEHVITHEIGHCLGLRHTDFFNRRLSCGTERDRNGDIIDPNEGQSSSGAILIPGTPAMTNTDLNSIMEACFNSNTINTRTRGEFTASDIIALRELW